MVSGDQVLCTETDLTGEPDAFVKVAMDEGHAEDDQMSGVLLAKSMCTKGSGTAIVIACGLNTAAGSIAGSNN